jgi:uncharacterized repeat protein (TIGR01451 family)
MRTLVCHNHVSLFVSVLRRGPQTRLLRSLGVAFAAVFGASILLGNALPRLKVEAAPLPQMPVRASMPDARTRTRLNEAYGRLPLSFEANQGQTDARVKFISRGRGYALFLAPDEAVLALQQAERQPASQRSAGQQAAVLRMKFVGGNPTPQIVGEGAAPGHINYLVGNDATRWRTGVPTYAQVVYRELYPGIDLIYYGNQQQLEYDFRLAPGSRPETIKLSFDGARRLSLDRRGNLVLHLQDGEEVRQPRPLVYQEVAGVRRSIKGAYVLQGHNRVGIKVGAYDVTRPLVIDPVLIYSTYLGGTSSDRGQAIAVDASGSAYVAGYTFSQDFPVVSPIQNTRNGVDADVFVAKLNADGSALVYATYLGGSADDQATSIALDQSGAAYVTGYTYSNNFPTVNPLQATLNGGANAFVVKLNATGAALDYATYLGGSGYDTGKAIAVDSAGNAYVAGFTLSQDFPVVNPIQPTRQGSLLFKSTDTGGNWAGRDNGLPGFYIFALKVDPTMPATVYAATDIGVYKSLDGGSSWHVSNPTIARLFALAPSNPNVLYATDLGYELFKSTDSGNSWTVVSTELDFTTSLVVDPTNAATLYASGDQGVRKSTNGGSSWTPVNNGLTDTFIESLVINPANPAILYARTQSIIYKTTNGGGSWTQLRNGLPFDNFISTLAIAPSNPDTLYANLLDSVYKTTDGGQHWTKTGSSPPHNNSLTTLAVAPSDANVVYAAGFLTGGVFRSNDGGNTWQLGSNGFTSRTVLSLEVEPTNPANVYAGVSGGGDSFVAKLNAAGSALGYATYLGGTEADSALALAVGGDGSAYVAGYTQSINFPVVNPLQATNHGSDDGFVAKLNPAGTALDYATYLGGYSDEFIYGLALDPAENVYLTGSTTSSDFPTVNPLQADNAGGRDAFVTRLNNTGSTITYSTYLGGAFDDYARGIAVGASGEPYVVGLTSSPNFPTVAPLQASRNSAQDAFITQLNESGTALKFSTYLGGSSGEIAYDVVVDASGNAYVTGATNSNNFPTVNPLQPIYRGGDDAFIFKLATAADLSLTMTGSRASVMVNESLTYTLTATNHGPLSATDVRLTDALPPTVTPGTVTTTRGTCGVTNANVTCQLGDLPPQATAVISINVTPTSAGQISNTASVQGRESDPSAANNTATLATTVTALQSISGHIRLATGGPLGGALVTLSGGQNASTQTDANGDFAFANLLTGFNYTLTPTTANYTFTPAARTFFLNDVQPSMDFTATPVPNVVQFSAAGYSFNEGAARATVAVTRSGDPNTVVAVNYRTGDTDTFTFGCADTVNNHGGAYARCDFAPAVGTLQFAAGETSKTITVAVIDDALVEGNETFQIMLSNPTGATLGAPDACTVTIEDNDTTAGVNPIFATPFFVRQQYLDFLSREPEAGEPWSGVLNRCADVNNIDPNNPAAGCDRLTVSAAFFGSPEFQLKGFYVYRFYKVAFGRLPAYVEIVPDMSFVAGSTAAEVYARKAQLAVNFTLRPEFQTNYGALSNADFVALLLNRYQLTQINAPEPADPDGTQKVTLTSAALVDKLNAHTLTRAQVFRAVADSDQVGAAEFNQAFVAMQYYGYLRRTPDNSGYQAWLNYLNAHPTDFRTMVNGFMNSTEYRLRFGSPNP